MTTKGIYSFFGDEENVLELYCANVAQLCEYTKITKLYTLNGECYGM